MANGLDWYISQSSEGKELAPAVGFDLKRVIVEEEDEEPTHEEEDKNKNKVPQWGRRKVR
jgi:hypothetical protein